MDTIRAWKDPEYRKSLDVGVLPRHPSGLTPLGDDVLDDVAGGRWSNEICLPTLLICV